MSKFVFNLYSLCLDTFRDLDDKIRGIALVVMRRDKVIKSHKSKSKILGLRVLKTGENYLHN